MLVAVTGGTGFLGRYVLRQLAALGHRLRCWHRPGSERGGLEDLVDAIEWLPGQLGDDRATHQLVEGAEAVVHAALNWQPSRGTRAPSEDDTLAFLDTNLMGSLKLMHAAHTAKVERFIHISTCAVHEVICDDRLLDEAHPCWPTSHYGAHKAALEAFVSSYGYGQRWPICALRPTGIYGLAQPPRKSRWFELIGQVLRGEPINTARGGKEVHAADVAKAIALLLHCDVKYVTGQVYNCYDMYIAEQDVAMIAKEMAGSNSPIADMNRGPKHQIVSERILALGMTFGGEALLEQTVADLVAAWQAPG